MLVNAVDQYIFALEGGGRGSAEREQAMQLDNNMAIHEVSESGWTTYLNTSCGSLTFSESMVLQSDDNIGNNNSNNVVKKWTLRECEGVPDEESNCSLNGSTVSDASSGPQLHQPACINANHFHNGNGLADHPVLIRPKRFASEPAIKCREFKKMRHYGRAAAAFISPDLEDTATSSPLHKHEDAHQRVLMQPASPESTLDKRGSDDVSKRFKVLEALIPRLNELAGRASEEEMLKVIISYIQALEFKVEVLSNVWQILRARHPRLHNNEL